MYLFKCDKCGEIEMTGKIEGNVISIRDREVDEDYEYSICKNCLKQLKEWFKIKEK